MLSEQIGFADYLFGLEKICLQSNRQNLMVKTETKWQNSGRSGFTLLELLVVVGILAALVALALPFYQDYVNQSKMTAAEADLQTFKKALAMYDQMEAKMFGSNLVTDVDLKPLIGRYLQDYRTSAGQMGNPVDPWGNNYNLDPAVGSIWSSGPDGVSASANSRAALGDDLLTTWKPDFFLATAKKINNRTIELTFSRKVSALVAGNVTAPAGAATIYKVSDTVFRVGYNADLPGPGTWVTVATTISAQDGRLLSAAKLAGPKPDAVPVDTAQY